MLPSFAVVSLPLLPPVAEQWLPNEEVPDCTVEVVELTPIVIVSVAFRDDASMYLTAKPPPPPPLAVL